MRWVLMLFVVPAAVMRGAARAVVVMGREVVFERVGKAVEELPGGVARGGSGS